MCMSMKITRMAIAFAAIIVAVSSCKGNGVAPASDTGEPVVVGDVTLGLKEMSGDAFAMGLKPDGRRLSGANGLHEVILDGYAISETPVTQALWEAVMGDNPSSTVGADLPVDRVAYKDCEAFVSKLSKKTGRSFFIPTEAQWEYAVRHGIEAGIGNLREWTADHWGEETTKLSVNPAGPATGNDKVVRTASSREAVSSYTKGNALTFRIAVLTGKPCDGRIVEAIEGRSTDRESVSSGEKIEVAGVTFDMVGIEGGAFSMGATSEQGKYGDEQEKPVMEVVVEGFELSSTEVTVAQWKAVMGCLPYGNEALDKPVVNVSWYDAQRFILRLNALSGRLFRLPSEAEWEYAARGGASSKGYRYSGSNQVVSVAVYADNSDELKVDKVGTKSPNELGLYDMSGNAWEWCQDSYAKYGEEAPDAEWKVMRGGSAASRWNACRVSNRSNIPASNVKGTFGFRLAI